MKLWGKRRRPLAIQFFNVKPVAIVALGMMIQNIDGDVRDTNLIDIHVEGVVGDPIVEEQSGPERAQLG